MGSLCNSEIFVVTVVDLNPEQMAVAPALTEKMSKEAWDLLESAKAKVEEANIKCEAIVHTGGQVHEFVIKEAKDKEIDLIVIGTHGRTGLKRFIIGSVAQKIIGYAPCPVLVIPTLR